MNRSKFFFIVILSFLILAGCSLVNKIKEKLSSKDNTTSVKENTKEGSSDDDMKFYNKYIEVMNKIQESGENVYKYYLSDVPSPGSITKNSLIIPVSLRMASGTLSNTAKDLNRSLLDGGELSKLNASDDMQTDLETDLKNLLPLMEEYSIVSDKVSEYYFNRDYKNDMSKIKPYDDEIKSAYNNYKTAFNKFSADLKKYKPKRKIYDPSTASDPDEASAQVMLNAYGDILDGAENFYESFENLNYNDNMTDSDNKFREFQNIYKESKNSIMNAEFGEKVKIMKYQFEDYFDPTAENFINTGIIFFSTVSKNEKDFKDRYNDMIIYYNKMINSYNTNIGTINRIRSF